MSGGHFDYIQDRIRYAAAEALADYIEQCETGKADEWGFTHEWTPETLAKFRECEQALWAAAAMLQRVDWLISGDDGEETFHARWAKEVPVNPLRSENDRLRAENEVLADAINYIRAALQQGYSISVDNPALPVLEIDEQKCHGNLRLSRAALAAGKTTDG